MSNPDKGRAQSLSGPHRSMGQACSEQVLSAQELLGATELTSIQKQLDRRVVVGQDGVVQGCAALEIGSDVQAVVEVILPGYKDCGEGEMKAQLIEMENGPSEGSLAAWTNQSGRLLSS